MKHIFLFILSASYCFFILGCRSQKEALISHQSSIDHSSEASFSNDVAESASLNFFSGLSLDSVDIVIERSWVDYEGIPVNRLSFEHENAVASDSCISNLSGYNLLTANTGLNSRHPVSERISFRAAKVSAVKEIENTDSFKRQSSSFSSDSLKTESFSSSSDNSYSVSVFDPPDAGLTIGWSLFIGASILFLVWLIKKRIH